MRKCFLSWALALIHRFRMPLKVVVSQPAGHAPSKRRMFENLEGRALLAANVLTDQQDYSPGQTAIVSAWNSDGSGFDFTKPIEFQVTRRDGIGDLPNGNLPWVVQDGFDGFAGYYVDSDLDGDFDYGVFPDTNSAQGEVSTVWFVEGQYADSLLTLNASQDDVVLASHDFTDAALQLKVSATSNGTFNQRGNSSSALDIGVVSGSTPVQFYLQTSNASNTTVTFTQSTPTGVTGISTGISFSPSSVTLGSTAAVASSTATLDISTLGLTQGTVYYALCRATFTAGGTTTTDDVWVKFTAGTTANGSGSLTVGSQSGTATYAGASDDVTFLVDATRNSNGTFNGTYSVSGLPSGVTSSFSTTSFSSSGSNAYPDPTLTLTVGSTVPAGSYQFTVTCTPSNSGSSAFANTGTLVVQRAGLTIAANNLTKTYGNTLTLDNTTPGDFVVTGLSNSDAVTSITLTSSGAVATANVGSYSIVPSAAVGSGLSNYDITYNNGSLSVQTRAVTISADAKSKTYADGNPALTATEGNTVAGAAALDYSLATTADQFSDVGSYPISITLGSNPNYSVTTTGGSLTVNQRSVTVTADAKSKIYADANPALTATEGNTVAGAAALDYSLATTADQFSDVGSYAITVSLGSNPNYNVTTTGGSLTVDQRSVTVTADAKSKTYADTNPALTATEGNTVAGAVALDYSLATTAGQFSDVGSYAITVSLGSNPNYNVTTTGGSLTVNQRSVTVTADAKSKTYADANPALTATEGNTVAGAAALDYSLATTAGQFSDVGSYAITVSLGSNPNYNVTTPGGSLTVNQRSVTVTADAKSKTYADGNPALTATEGNTVAGAAALDYSLATTADQFSDVGSYSISIILGSNPNYSVTTTGGSLTVNQRSVTVTADAKSKIYADANPALTATEGNTVAGAAALDYSLATTADQFSDVGSYPISITLGSNPNYSVTTTGGSLTVNQRSVTVIADAKSKIYADANPALTATEGNTVAGAAALDYSLATTAEQFSDVGSYPISITLGSNPNYSVTTTGGSLTVNQRSVTVTADAKSKIYADANPALTATEGDTVAGAAALDYSLATTADQFSDVGSYSISIILGSNPNYSVTTTAGSLTVNQRSVTVTADAKSKIYGVANPTLTATEGNTVAGAAALDYSLATTADQFSDVGSYSIIIILGSNPNYSVTTTDGSLSVNQRSVTVTADAKSKIYGDADPSLTYAVTSGSVVVGDSFSGSLSRATGENVGTYAINQGSVSLGSNYSLSYVGANLTINQRAATIVANAFTRLFGEANPTFTAVVSGTANNETLNYSLTTVATQFSPVGSYTILVSLGSNPNYSVVTTPSTLTIEERDAAARYIGQTIAVASGSSATSAQISLAASVQDPTGLGLVGAKVTFIDTLTNRVLASNVPVSPVAGSPFNGTANTFVTLSTGTYGSQLYNVKVIVTGNYTNEAQLSGSSASITVTKPAGTEMISASGRIAQSSGVAGTYGVTVSGDATFSVDLKYNKSGKNLQGKVELLLPSSDGSQIYIKSNALNSMVIDGQKVNGTVYVKANATRLNADGTTTTLEGNISLRIDLSEANSGMVAITAMSSTSQLLYSNDWYFDETLRGWKSRLSAVSSGLIQLN